MTYVRCRIIGLIVLATLYAIQIKAQATGKLEEQVLQGVVSIDNNGSGFLVSTKENGKTHLITNKHMIGRWSLIDPFIPSDSITIYFYSNDTASSVKPISIAIAEHLGNGVVIHPDEKIDVAAINITEILDTIQNAYIVKFESDYLVPIDSLDDVCYLGLGDQVFAIGYPSGLKSETTNHPFIKSAFVSSVLTGEIVVNLPFRDRNDNAISVAPSGKYFLLDGLIVGGNSGGPVVNPREIKYVYSDDLPRHTTSAVPNYILGIVSMAVSNTGMNVIFATDHILELIID